MIQQQVLTKKRAFSLDALRGYAILTMVLSGTIASNLPLWNYHAQVPPGKGFDPTIFGITWVDLVFPFFQFAMGAAFPFSLGRKLREGVAKWKLTLDSVIRGLQLCFFAIFLQHMKPFIISEPQNVHAWLISLLAFALMFPMFMNLPNRITAWLRWTIKLAAYGAATALMMLVSYAGDRTFSVNFSDIIIVVLANMAIFGSIVYIFTYDKPLARIAVLPFVMAILLTRMDGSSDGWQKWVMNYSPIPWLYNFYYLKYLFIVIPGSIAGEYLYGWIQSPHEEGTNHPRERQLAYSMLVLTVGLVVMNLYGLYTRQLLINLWGSLALVGVGLAVFKQQATSAARLWQKLFYAGAYLLLLGLAFEAFEGGIRKDHSTFSYYFVTSGLAFMALIAFSVICDYLKWNRSTSFLVKAGQNPMIAYVGPSIVVPSLLSLLGLWGYIVGMVQTPFLGFLKGVLITALVTLIAIFFTRIKWFWRT